MENLKDAFNELEKAGIIGSRVELTIDGKLLMSMTINRADVPKDDKQTIALLKDIIGFLEAPTVPDAEVLGKYSPKL